MQVGHDHLGRTDPDIAADAPHPDIHHAERVLAEIEIGDDTERSGEVDAVEERGVHRIHGVLLHLDPIARQNVATPWRELVVVKLEGIVDRKRRLHVGRAHIGENQSFEFLDRVGAVPQPVLERAVGRLARRLQDLPVHVEHPAVIAAHDAAFLDDAELERCAAVRAIERKQANAAGLVLEQSKILAEHTGSDRHVFQICSEADRMPEPAEVLTARRAGPDLRQLLVLGELVERALVAGILAPEKSRPLRHHRLPWRICTCHNRRLGISARPC